jgi:hypothetical protein
MKKLFLALFVIALFCGCGKEISRPTLNQDIDPAFAPYWQSFKDEANARFLSSSVSEQDVYIQFGDLDENLHGECIDGRGGDSIVISRDYWDTIDQTQREILIFHEIGHCQLTRPHVGDGGYLLSYSVAPSLMVSSINGCNGVFDPYSPKWRAYYIDELFGFPSDPEWLDLALPYDIPESPTELFFELDGISSSSASSSSIELESEDKFQAIFQNSTDGDFSIRLNDFRLAFSYETAGFTIFDDDRQIAFVEFFFYLNQVRSTGTVTITLRHVDGILYFYIGDYLVHFREFEKPESVDLEILSTTAPLDARLALERF